MQIEEIMTKDVAFCRVDESLNVAARIMWERDCGCVPVVDLAGRPVGMLTDRDICMAAYASRVGADGRLAGILSLSDLARTALRLKGGKPADAIETALVAICRPRTEIAAISPR